MIQRLTDIDECAEGTAACAQTCTNVPGSYFCSCGSGYRLAGDRLGCDDIDECAEDLLSNCSQTCMNSIGGYNCSCNPGYQLASDGQMCNGKYLFILLLLFTNCELLQNSPNTHSDIDECAENVDGCAQICLNEGGSYSCSCPSGYQLANDGWRCTDIDECAENNMGNCSHNCTNTIGSYNCSCNSGYRIASDNYECDGKAYLIK